MCEAPSPGPSTMRKFFSPPCAIRSRTMAKDKINGKFSNYKVLQPLIPPFFLPQTGAGSFEKVVSALNS